jgi:hypothetical protein
MHATRPTYEEVMTESQALSRQVPGYCTFEEMGKSFQGRPIPLLTLTDPAVPLAQKGVAFLTGGTHGAEEVGRAATLALAGWLTTNDGAQHLRTQVILICPCLNPDGATRNSYHNAQDINIYTAFPLGAEPTTPEARAAYAVAQQWIPDCYADVHGLAGGAIGDSQYVPVGRNPGLFLMSLAISHEMDAAAEAIGYPQRFCRIVPVCQGQQHQDSLFLRLMMEDNALTYTVETTENYYPLADSIRSALARLSTLIKAGDRVSCYQPYRGYPCDLLAGSPVGCLMTYGGDYQQRRVNRRKTVRAICDGAIYSVSRVPADPDHVATVRVELHKPIADPPDGIVLQLRLDPRVTVRRATFNDAELQPGGEDGYQLDIRPNYLAVRAALRRALRVGSNDLRVEYDAPFVPHAD